MHAIIWFSISAAASALAFLPAAAPPSRVIAPRAPPRAALRASFGFEFPDEEDDDDDEDWDESGGVQIASSAAAATPSVPEVDTLKLTDVPAVNMTVGELQAQLAAATTSLAEARANPVIVEKQVFIEGQPAAAADAAVAAGGADAAASAAATGANASQAASSDGKAAGGAGDGAIGAVAATAEAAAVDAGAPAASGIVRWVAAPV